MIFFKMTQLVYTVYHVPLICSDTDHRFTFIPYRQAAVGIGKILLLLSLKPLMYLHFGVFCLQ